MRFPKAPSRRRFLELAGTSSIVSLLSGCGSDSAREPEFGDVPAGNVAELPIGALEAVTGAPAFLGRDAGGVYAMSSICTHQGCDMTRNGFADETGIYCSCHASHFDAVGAVLSGPATIPLSHFAVEIDAGGNLTVRGRLKVSAEARTPV
jgi:Rieske Fe-S protein